MFAKMKSLLTFLKQYLGVFRISSRYDIQSKWIAMTADGVSITICFLLLYLSKIDLGSFTAALAAIASLSFVIEQFFFNEVQTLVDFYADLATYKEFIEEPVSMREKQKLHRAPDIRFENVSFSYPGQERAVLKKINLHIQSGEKIALVGYNGAGKSTLAKLACGLYIPDLAGESRVLIDGRDSRQWQIFSEFSAVFQEHALYKMSLSENITMGRGILDLRQELSELVPAGLLEDLEGMGLSPSTRIGAEFSGVELSGGWQEIIAILRVIYSDKPFYIFDEATSAIDPQKEEKVIRLMLDASEGKTAIFITHRMALCQFVDRIILLENGEIIESGPFKELYAQRGRFYEFYSEQEKWYQ